jgi:hypothetical protein
MPNPIGRQLVYSAAASSRPPRPRKHDRELVKTAAAVYAPSRPPDPQQMPRHDFRIAARVERMSGRRR